MVPQVVRASVSQHLRCSDCLEIFMSAELLKDHINKKKLTKYRCEYCDEGFNSSLKFKHHCTSHNITHPFKCTDCGKKYTNENAMKVHNRSHINYRPYQCPLCESSFSQSSTLSTHVQRHSGMTPFICEVCEKAFATKGDLRTHHHIHRKTRQFCCEVCGKSFPRKSNLTRHNRKHTGEKPYECEFCQKCFARSENCQEHRRIHTNERPYKCDVCGASFSDSGNFCNHKKIHLEKQPRSKRGPKKKSTKNNNSTIAGTLEPAMKPISIDDVHPSFQHLLEKFKISPSKESLLPPAYFSTNSTTHMAEKLGPHLLTISHDLLVSQLGRTVDVESDIITYNEKRNTIFLQNSSLWPNSITLVDDRGTYDSIIGGFSLQENHLNHYIDNSSQSFTSIVLAETNNDMNNHDALGDANHYFNNDYFVSIAQKEENAK